MRGIKVIKVNGTWLQVVMPPSPPAPATDRRPLETTGFGGVHMRRGYKRWAQQDKQQKGFLLGFSTQLISIGLNSDALWSSTPFQSNLVVV